jgi:uncharacterized protein (TIGR03435 family)
MTIMRALAATLFIAAALAQDKPSFEVASIRPGSLSIPGGWMRRDPGMLSITNLTLKEMIVSAWRVRPFQVLGGPAWVDSARYNISAKPEGDVKYEQQMLKLQSLLAERFQLSMHSETRDLPIYALVLARKDGKLGAGLVETKEGTCKVAEPNSRPERPEPGKPTTPLCRTIMMNPRFLCSFDLPIAGLAGNLSEILGRQVIDQTGLTGNFNINLEWTPNESQALQLPPGVPAPPPPDSPVSIFTAIQEQLGLKLESRKGPVQVWVIDRAEKPSEN